MVESSYLFLGSVSSQYPALLGRWPLVIKNSSVGCRVARFPPGSTDIVYAFLYALVSLIFQCNSVLKFSSNSVRLDSDLMLKIDLIIFQFYLYKQIFHVWTLASAMTEVCCEKRHLCTSISTVFPHNLFKTFPVQSR